MTALPVLALLAGAAVTTPTAAAPGPSTTGALYVVQAVPGETYRVKVDDEHVEEVSVGRVLGPFELAPGKHDVDLEAGADGARLTMAVDVLAGSVTDLVVHQPADPGGDPVVTTYAMPTQVVDAGQSRVLVAHTATVAPADVAVDGRTVFTNIANGEFAVADVPSGRHQVALYATGTTTDPLLGPVVSPLPVGALTAVFAVGNPDDGSMDVIIQRLALATRSVDPPRRIDTGAAGLVSEVGPAYAGG